ncbi:alpha-aspartyl dipeptidase-like [Hemiscyllium ocellatum]|uniref:alpha-aspartyl dipeptidase-like n=1 Tax=Hemiscyllium ocellatum TaxID=170820 RepID=UPI002966ADE6|nr:alpha-aspartyl dipeptidase-like [Hemiscyllium ocellatum]
MKRRALLVSNSTMYGGSYLEHCQEQIVNFFGDKVKRILFIPYALHDRDAYAKKARCKFESLGYGLDSIHEVPDPVGAVQKAQGIFVGGGNTFRLLKVLYDNKLVSEIHRRVFQETREKRIEQYHEEPDTPPVMGLREGSMLLVEGDKATLLGTTGARLFIRGEKATEHDPGADFSFLLTDSH